MNWNNLSSAWQHQHPRAGLAEVASLAATFDAKSRKQASDLFWRDLRPVLVSVFLAVALTYMARQQPTPVRVASGIAVVGIVATAVYLLSELTRRKRGRPASNAPLLAKLDADIAELRHQQHVLLVVAPRLLAVIALGLAIILAATLAFQGPLQPGQLRRVAAIIVALPVIIWAAYVRNRWEARRRVEPRLAELDRLREDLMKTDGS